MITLTVLKLIWFVAESNSSNRRYLQSGTKLQKRPLTPTNLLNWVSGLVCKTNTKMQSKLAFLLVLDAVIAPFLCSAAFDQAEEDKALAFLKKFNNETQEDYKSTVASWNYATNITTQNKELKTNGSLTFSAFYNQMRQNASKFDVGKLSEDTKRQIQFIISTATPTDATVLKKVTELQSSMEGIFSTGKVKDDDGTRLQLDPDLYKILTSRDYDRLLFVWKGWRDAVGPKLRPLYKQFVKLKNQGAKENENKNESQY